jgi:hypothetical protein
MILEEFLNLLNQIEREPLVKSLSCIFIKKDIVHHYKDDIIPYAISIVEHLMNSISRFFKKKIN